MSKLLEKLERIEEGNPSRLGFGAAAAQSNTPCMLLLAYLPSGDAAQAAALASLGMDGVVLKVQDPGSAQGPDDVLWGAWLEVATPEELVALKERGCDFIAFGPERMPLESLAKDDLGRVLVMDSTLSEERRQIVDALPVDTVLVVPPQDQGPLTVMGLMDIGVAAGGTGKSVLLLRSTVPSRGEVESLRGAGISGLVMDASQVDAAALEGLREVINTLPRRKARRERRTALLPRPPQGRQQRRQEEGDEEEEEEDVGDFSRLVPASW